MYKFLIATSLLLYFGSIYFDKFTDGFSVARIHSALSYNPEWATPPPTKQERIELEKILSQKFHYLGCGGQCFAFASEDDQYVIKFFKHRFRKPYSFFYRFLEKKRNKAISKHTRDFTSYKIAYEDLREETGLVYIQLNKGPRLRKSVTIVDKLKIAHQIELDDVEFIVQKKGELVYSRMEELMKENDIAGARAVMRAMLDVIVSRCRKGIFDEDAGIHRNFGFIGDKPFFIDIGRFRRDPSRQLPDVYNHDLQLITKRFRAWLEESYPPLALALDEELNRAQEGLVNLDSARQSQIEAQRSERRSPAPSGQGEKEDRFGKVAASPNSSNVTEGGSNEIR
jgi:hypothetical protein